MGGIRPSSNDDPDPDLEEAIRRYVEANPDSEEAGRWNALGAPKPLAALSSMAVGAGPKRPEEMSPDELDAAVQEKLGPKSGWKAPPKPTPQGEAVYADLLEAGRASQDPALPSASMPLPSAPVAAEVPSAGSVRPASTRAEPQLRGNMFAAEKPPNFEPDPLVTPYLDDEGPAPPGSAPPAAVAGPPSQQRQPADGVPPEALAAARKELGLSPLDQALQSSANNRLIAGMVRAGGMAIGRGTGAGYDALDENAGAPLRDYGLRQGEAEKQRALTARAAEADPASAQSRSAWTMMEELIPGVSAKIPPEGRSAARLKELFPWAKEVLDRDAAKASLTAKGEEARLGRENALKVASIRAKGKGGGKGGLTPAQELQREKFDQSLREKASKDSVEPSELSDALGRIEGALAKGGDMPGVGRGAGRLAAWGIGSDEGIQLRTDLTKLGNIILHARSGAAVTPTEMERAQIETGTAPGATEQQVQIAGKAAVAVMRRAEANLRAKYPGRTWETIGTEGGWVPGAKGAASVVEERTAPDGRVLQKLSDGSIRVKG